MFCLFRNFLKDTSGSFIPLFGVSGVVILMVSGMALDYTRAVRDIARSQNALDSAALAVANEISTLGPDDLAALSQQSDSSQTELGQRLEGVARLYFETNLSPSLAEPVDLDTRIEAITDRKYRITVLSHGATPTAFLTIANRDAINWTNEATSLVELPKLELTLVADVSASMRYTDIHAMKAAMSQLVDNIFANNEVNELHKVSVIPFAESVNFGDAYRGWLDPALSNTEKSRYHGCFRPEFDRYSRSIKFGTVEPGKYRPLVYSSSYGMPYCPANSSRVELFSSDPVRLKERINGLTKGYGTGSGVATMWGLRTLLPSWRGRFVETSQYPRDFGAQGAKYMILLTDGRPIQFDPEGDGKYYGITWWYTRTAVATAAFVDACNAIKAQSGTINVYTIAYRFDNAGTTARNNLQNCVNGSGKFYEANLNNLSDVFKAIGKDITRVRLGS